MFCHLWVLSMDRVPMPASAELGLQSRSSLNPRHVSGVSRPFLNSDLSVAFSPTVGTEV